MNEQRDFDDGDENIFPEEDISQVSPSKGNRVIPMQLMGEFISWLDYYHREIPMITNVPRQRLKQLINEFELHTRMRYEFTVQDWEYDLKRR